jgi:uncharacterized membrane protein
MAFIGRLHPLLIHFPIALVLAAPGAEIAAIVTRDARWRAAALANIRGGAVFALFAAATGWRLAAGTEPTPPLEWHRWLGAMTAGVVVAAAVAVPRADSRRRAQWAYRIALATAGVLVAIAGHLGAVLVWGADFLRP